MPIERDASGGVIQFTGPDAIEAMLHVAAPHRQRADGGRVVVFRGGVRFGPFPTADAALHFATIHGWADARIRMAYPPDYWPSDEPRMGVPA